MRSMIPGWAALAVLGLQALACSPRDADPGSAALASAATEAAENPQIVAVFAGGRVTQDDIDAFVLSVPGSERAALDSEALRAAARRLAADRLLLAAAHAEGFDSERPGEREELDREALASQCLFRQLLPSEPPPEQVTEAALREIYDRRQALFERAGQRQVFNIFLRRSDKRSDDALHAELAELRRRILAGEGFGRLAAEHSDSETRHQNGDLGWFSRGQLAPELDAIVFALDERVPSEPIVTQDGGHLFWVETALEARALSFEGARPALRNLARVERREARIRALIERIDRPSPDRFVATAEELRALASAGQPAAPVLRIGDYTLTVDGLRAKLAYTAAQPGTDPALQILGQIERREIFYRHCRDAGVDLGEEGKAWIEEQREQRAIDRYRRTRLERLMDSDPNALARYFETNRKRFSTPLELDLRRVRIPLDAQAPAEAAKNMTRLEALAGQPATGRLASDQAAERLGGTVEDLGTQTLASLGRIDPRMVERVADVPAGHYGAPYRTETSLDLLEVVARREPGPRPYTEVEPLVRAAFLQQRGQALYRKLEESLLREAGFHLFEDRFPRPAGIMQKK